VPYILHGILVAAEKILLERVFGRAGILCPRVEEMMRTSGNTYDTRKAKVTLGSSWFINPL